MTRYLRDLKKKLQAEGVNVAGITEGRKSACVYFRTADGGLARYFTGLTPSDHRAPIKATRDIVRMARAGGPAP